MDVSPFHCVESLVVTTVAAESDVFDFFCTAKARSKKLIDFGDLFDLPMSCCYDPTFAHDGTAAEKVFAAVAKCYYVRKLAGAGDTPSDNLRTVG